MDETKCKTHSYDYENCFKIKRSHNITVVFVGFSDFILKILRLSKPTNCVLTRISDPPFRFPVCE